MDAYLASLVGGRGTIEGLTIAEIARRAGTPTFIVSEGRLVENHAAFCGAFEPIIASRVFFSVKANSLDVVLRRFAALGAGAEACSGLEVALALRAGFSPVDVIFNGPAKSREELAYAVAKRIGLVNVESSEELRMVSRLSQQAGRRTKVGVRVDPSGQEGLKLGLSPAQAYRVLVEANVARGVDLAALHMHLGTNLQDPRAYASGLLKLLGLRARLEAATGHRIPVLDVGGGFPDRAGPPWVNYARSLRDASRDFAPFELFLEPGRGLVNDAVFCLSRVLSVRQKGRFNWAYVDVGAHLLPPLRNAGYGLAWTSSRSRGRKVRIAGPLCMADDVFPFVTDARLKVGDLVLLSHCGAYTVTFGSVFAAARPAVVGVRGRRLRLVRKRESWQAPATPR